MKFLAAFVVFFLCFLAMMIGVLVTKRPLQKRCSANPDEPCDCQGQDECPREEK